MAGIVGFGAGFGFGTADCWVDFAGVLVVGRAGEVSALFGGGGLGGFGGFADFKGGDALVALVVWLSGAAGLTFRATFADCFNSTGFTGTGGGF